LKTFEKSKEKLVAYCENGITLIEGSAGGGLCFQMKNVNFVGLHIRQGAGLAGCKKGRSGGLFHSPPARLYVCVAHWPGLMCSLPTWLFVQPASPWKIDVIHLETWPSSLPGPLFSVIPKMKGTMVRAELKTIGTADVGASARLPSRCC